MHGWQNAWSHVVFRKRGGGAADEPSTPSSSVPAAAAAAPSSTDDARQIGHVSSSAALPITAGLAGAGRPAVALATAVALLAVFKHRENLKRIAAGTEPKFGSKE